MSRSCAGAADPRPPVWETSIGVVTGDDLLPRLEELRRRDASSESRYRRAAFCFPLSAFLVVSANAYLGPDPLRGSS
jgi:hypothetical protein